MENQNRKCLLDIPGLLFRKFFLSGGPRARRYMEFDEPLLHRGHYSVHVSFPKNPASRELTFVLIDYRCPWGSGHQSKFFVFSHPVEILEFVPNRGEFLLPSLIDVRFSVKEPLRDDVSNTWIKGRGFWVEECLKISRGSDWDEFVSRANRVQMESLMRVYTRAVELYESVLSHHHWQFEWFPGGIYSERPSFRRH